MINTQYRIILLRHAESIKNVKKIHGGQGEELTEKGIKQCHAFSDILRNHIDLSKLRIFASTSFHTRATASIICEDLNISLEKPIDFKPLYLGVADGLSEKELEDKDPIASNLFIKWRKKEIDIKELKVKDMEHYMTFWNRGLNIIENLPHDSNVVLVCSNSLMILLSHIMLNNHPETSNKYRHIDIKNCESLTFFTSDLKNFTVDKSLSNVEEYGLLPKLVV